ncbi:MAG: hypothetical protein MJY71_06880 [Bacteroidaceae bacterium]|nr:hypothetical protein [Bacteroidaceae bacterium]
MKMRLIVRKYFPIKAKWPHFLLKYVVKKRYKTVMGYELDLDNPKTFNEKIQWYKLYYDNPVVPTVTNKLTFKKYIEDKLGSDKYTAKLYGHWYSVSDLKKEWDNLPNEFVLKSNMSFGGNNLIFVSDKASAAKEKIFNDVSNWLDVHNTMMNTCSCRFYNGTPCIIAEEFLKQDGHSPDDYKFFCFDGMPYCAYVATGHFEKGGSAISFYDMDWNFIDVKYADYKSVKIEKPQRFEEMLEIAKKLSAGFPFVRVDFFNIGEDIYLSELTFDSGDGHRKFTPASFDEELGKQFRLTRR